LVHDRCTVVDPFAIFVLMFHAPKFPTAPGVVRLDAAAVSDAVDTASAFGAAEPLRLLRAVRDEVFAGDERWAVALRRACTPLDARAEFEDGEELVAAAIGRAPKITPVITSKIDVILRVHPLITRPPPERSLASNPRQSDLHPLRGLSMHFRKRLTRQ
jgi:hypothetical protein